MPAPSTPAQSDASLRYGLAARLGRAAVGALVVHEIKLAQLDLSQMRVLDAAPAGTEEEAPRTRPSLSALDRYRGRLLRARRKAVAMTTSAKAGPQQVVYERTRAGAALGAWVGGGFRAGKKNPERRAARG